MNTRIIPFILAGAAMTSIVFAQGPPPRPGDGRAGYARGGEGGEMFSSPVVPKSDREKAVVAVLEEMDRNQRRGSMSVPMADGRILRLLAESMGATNVVEIGTSIGYSGIWFCLALEKTGGKLTTFEIDTGRANRARENFKRAGVDKLVTLMMGDAHEEVKKLKTPIDILFLDADKEGYIDYLEKLLPLLRPGGVIVAHNMNRNLADPRYVKAITTNPELETVFLNLQSSGIGVSMKKR
jgi:caffeoyl-CoA O-methyltransferase